MTRMHGLSVDTDLSPLNGCTLTFVGFGQHQLQLAFWGDADCAISVEGELHRVSAGARAHHVHRCCTGAATLLPLLGHTVTVAEVPSDGTVRVRFDDGSVVEAPDSQSRYESYQVNLGSRLLVV